MYFEITHVRKVAHIRDRNRCPKTKNRRNLSYSARILKKYKNEYKNRVQCVASARPVHSKPKSHKEINGTLSQCHLQACIPKQLQPLLF
jgi:hypothetical protein